MTEPISSINSADYFKHPETELPSQYDFNGDGTVDISDYNLALVYLKDDDPETKIDYTEDQLKNVFAALIEKEDKNQEGEYDKITENNVESIADDVIAAIRSDASSPSQVKTLKELQKVGKNLTRYIKECSEIVELYSPKIAKYKADLDKLAEDRKDIEADYATKEEEVGEKSDKLADTVALILSESCKLSDERKKQSDEVVKDCVKRYAKGEYGGRSLQEVMISRLAGIGFNVTPLQNAIDNSEGLSRELSYLCSDINALVGNIAEVTKNYNIMNQTYNSAVTRRNDVISAAKLASTKYQSGYQKRLDLRQALVDKYHVASAGGDKYTAANPQVVKLGEFLDNKELDNMPLVDAVAVLKATFNDCGIAITENGKGGVAISVPKGHDSTATHIYAAFVQSLKDNYGIGANVIDDTPEDDGYVDPTSTITTVTSVARTDPMSFTKGDVKYEFINDKNNDGIFNDESEFLGASGGWAEMKTYDTDGDGHISGDELKKLQVVGVNQTNGQFSFKSAADAGIADIDLSAYKDNTADRMKVNGDILDGTFSLKMTDGSTITGEQSYDMNRNLENNFATVFGSSIADTTDEIYNDNNPFLDKFKERVDTEEVTEQAKKDVLNASDESDTILKNGKDEVDDNVRRSTRRAETEKELNDKKEAREAQKAEEAKAKEEEKKQLEKEEEEKQEIEKAEAEKAEKEKKEV